MSGGHYNYLYHNLDELADYIEKDFLNDGKYMEEDYSVGTTYPDYNKKPLKESDRIGDANPDQRQVILTEIHSLINDLRKCAKRAKELEWYMSGDTGAESYLERLKKVL